MLIFKLFLRYQFFTLELLNSLFLEGINPDAQYTYSHTSRQDR
jgi:hypothetical protein